jgi:putative phosphoesterase
MRVAALYDVHGNLPALEAVLRDVQAEEVDVILFGGDLVDGIFPRETLERARSLPSAQFVRGNTDRFPESVKDPDWDAALRWIETQLEDEQIAWLAGLPFSVVLGDTLYVHATPQDDETVVTELTTDERFAEVLAGVEQRRVVAGHTHMQLERQVGAVLFVNPGSVGMPYEERPGAYWALLDDDAIQFRRSDYDLEAAAARFRESGHPLGRVLAEENLLQVPTRAEALASFG